MDGQFAARPRREHHQAHDALAVHRFTILLDEDFAREPAGGFHEHGSGPGVNALAVEDRQLFRQRGPAGGKFSRAHRLVHHHYLRDKARAIEFYSFRAAAICACSRASRSLAALWPERLSLVWKAATSMSRARSRPGRTG